MKKKTKKDVEKNNNGKENPFLRCFDHFAHPFPHALTLPSLSSALVGLFSMASKLPTREDAHGGDCRRHQVGNLGAFLSLFLSPDCPVCHGNWQRIIKRVTTFARQEALRRVGFFLFFFFCWCVVLFLLLLCWLG